MAQNKSICREMNKSYGLKTLGSSFFIIIIMSVQNVRYIWGGGPRLIFETRVLLKISDTESLYKHSYFKPLCLPAKMGTQTRIRSSIMV